MAPKWTARTYLAIVLAVLVALGAGTAAAFLFPRGSDEACVTSSNGQAVDCATAGAVSGQEHPADQANATRADHRAQRRAQACKAQVGELLASLENLDSRVTGGLQYATYSQRVERVRTLYGRVAYKDLAFDCLTKVGLPAEAALNSYAKADSIWHGCVTDPGCDMRGTESEVRRRWRDASAAFETPSVDSERSRSHPRASAYPCADVPAACAEIGEAAGAVASFFGSTTQPEASAPSVRLRRHERIAQRIRNQFGAGRIAGRGEVNAVGDEP